MVTNVYGPGGTNAIGAATSQSGVSWAAIFAGALAAGVLSLLLFMLGIGLGLSSVSVWSGSGADGSTVGWGALLWLIVTQLLSAAVGGYLAGRLRTKWQGVHTDEVYFRDTAHGFLAWALATVGMVVLAGSVLGNALSATGKAAATVATASAQVAGGVAGGSASAALQGVLGGTANQEGDEDLSYWISTLMRNSGTTAPQMLGSAAPAEAGAPNMQPAAPVTTDNNRSAAEDAKEVSLVFAQALKTGQLPDEDATYVARLIAQHSEVSEAEAKAKVQRTFAQIQEQIANAKQAVEETEQKAMEAAEAARKATAHSMLWMFVVLLIGAFVGSLSATYGGRMRNNE